MQTLLTSAATFAVGAAMPLLMVVVSLGTLLVPIVSGATLARLALRGTVGARCSVPMMIRHSLLGSLPLRALQDYRHQAEALAAQWAV
jgi:VIT1/CCC1 family predicted Fe2+/Mn2+ transporter